MNTFDAKESFCMNMSQVWPVFPRNLGANRAARLGTTHGDTGPGFGRVTLKGIRLFHPDATSKPFSRCKDADLDQVMDNVLHLLDGIGKCRS